MLRHTLAALTLASVVGCSANSSFQPFAHGGEDRAQLAAYAASAHYPTDVKTSHDARIAALINPRNESVKIVNFGDEPMRDVNVWVNNTFVHKVSVIPSHGSVTIDRAEFYDASGQDMKK